jgi:hypothetical protein
MQDELDAADGADAGDSGRLGREGDAAGDAEKLRSDVSDNGFGCVLVAHLGAVVDGLERSEDEAGVRRTAAGQREAHDREGTENTLIFANFR